MVDTDRKSDVGKYPAFSSTSCTYLAVYTNVTGTPVSSIRINKYLESRALFLAYRWNTNAAQIACLIRAVPELCNVASLFVSKMHWFSWILRWMDLHPSNEPVKLLAQLERTRLLARMDWSSKEAIWSSGEIKDMKDTKGSKRLPGLGLIAERSHFETTFEGGGMKSKMGNAGRLWKGEG